MFKSNFLDVFRKTAAFCLFVNLFFTPVFSSISLAAEQNGNAGEVSSPKPIPLRSLPFPAENGGWMELSSILVNPPILSM